MALNKIVDVVRFLSGSTGLSILYKVFRVIGFGFGNTATDIAYFPVTLYYTSDRLFDNTEVCVHSKLLRVVLNALIIGYFDLKSILLLGCLRVDFSGYGTRLFKWNFGFRFNFSSVNIFCLKRKGLFIIRK